MSILDESQLNINDIQVDQIPRDPIRGEYSKLIGSWSKSFGAIPVAVDEGVLVAACKENAHRDALRILELCYNQAVYPITVTDTTFDSILNSFRSRLMSNSNYSLDQEGKESESDNDLLTSPLKIEVTDSEDDDAPIIRYVNALVFRAAHSRASDIHVEPYEDEVRIRFRVDGVLQDIASEDKYFQAAISSRIKVMANLNIAEKRLPQDGRIGLKIAGEEVDIRVSTVPTRYGERIVLRLLDKSKGTLELESIGFNKKILEDIRSIIQKSYGIFLVTGPTGSGKTTTLYACLSEIHSVDKNILTIEDPIEYEISGVGQMQVNPKIDFTFASGLRSILRQDPDVIMVGEIRDLETVEIAIQASLTGHLVFSTLHTNDAPGAITRLLDMGVEPFLISSSILGVLAQRLVRCLCPDCKVPDSLSPSVYQQLIPESERSSLDQDLLSQPIFKASNSGCERCQFTGYLGRTAIHEFLLIDDAIRPLIMDRANSSDIRKMAKGITSLRSDGALKVFQGETSVDEVLRVTQEDLLDQSNLGT